MPKDSTSSTQDRSAIISVIVGTVLVLAGLPLLMGGVQLLALGGSAYYLLAGLTLAACGILIARRKLAGSVLYALLFGCTILWALWEAGLNFWPLIPRLVAPTVLAIPVALVTPLALDARRMHGRIAYGAAGGLSLALILCFVLLLRPHGTISGAPVPDGSALPVSGMLDWPAYGRTAAGTRYAPINQIDRNNVKDLQVAWTFRTGATPSDTSDDENTPLQVGSAVYTCSPENVVHALDADTGRRLWTFDPKASSPIFRRCRSVSFYAPPADTHEPGAAGTACLGRIVLTTVDARLIELDAKTGKPCQDFGDAGSVDLKQGMGEVKPGFFFQTSAPTVVNDLIILGGWVRDNFDVDEPSGVVRAFNAQTGALVWAWDLGDPSIGGLPGTGKTYTRGTPNMWSTPAIDEALGLIYLPTGNATPDFFGAKRSKLTEAFSSSVVALDIATGRVRWSFQTVHHDLWDYDVPAQPALYDMPGPGGTVVPALVQITKRGQIFLLDRRNGKALATVEERPVPQTGGVPEDFRSRTQPYSVGMPSVGTEPLTEQRMWGLTPFDQLICRIRFRQMRYEGEFTPPGTSPSIEYPGYYGGMNWGGASIDAARGLLLVNDIRIAMQVMLTPRDVADRYGPTAGHDGKFKQSGTPYGVAKINFMSPLGVPCQQPPYGTLTAIDLKSRKIAWQVPAGTLQDTGPLGVRTHLPIPIGMPTMGGPITTAGGLTFYAGTQDFYLRAFDTATGRELWKARLPVGAQATPITYVSRRSGRQFVVVSAGGSRESTTRGDYLVAYALPER